jgi:hypothetical protein
MTRRQATFSEYTDGGGFIASFDKILLVLPEISISEDCNKALAL